MRIEILNLLLERIMRVRSVSHKNSFVITAIYRTQDTYCLSFHGQNAPDFRSEAPLSYSDGDAEIRKEQVIVLGPEQHVLKVCFPPQIELLDSPRHHLRPESISRPLRKIARRSKDKS